MVDDVIKTWCNVIQASTHCDPLFFSTATMLFKSGGIVEIKQRNRHLSRLRLKEPLAEMSTPKVVFGWFSDLLQLGSTTYNFTNIIKYHTGWMANCLNNGVFHESLGDLASRRRERSFTEANDWGSCGDPWPIWLHLHLPWEGQRVKLCGKNVGIKRLENP